MFNDDELNDLLSRARAGDEAAIRDFLSRFELEVTTMVRSRLPRKLRTQFDSTDFVQAVWKSLLVETAPQSRAFVDVDHFRAYLYGMVRNKVSEQQRRLTKTAKYDLAKSGSTFVVATATWLVRSFRLSRRPARRFRPAIGCAIDGGHEPARGRDPHAAPSGADALGNRRSNRN